MNPRSDGRRPGRWNKTPVPARVAERAFLRRDVDSTGCWVSKYSTASHGYAQIGWQDAGSRHVVLAHRASWVHIYGQVPISMTLDHLCKNRRCVNPGHLRLLSNYENARRNNGADWAFGSCANGHPDTMLREVTRTAKSGRKYKGLICGECSRDSDRRWREKHPDKYRELTKRNNDKRKLAA